MIGRNSGVGQTPEQSPSVVTKTKTSGWPGTELRFVLPSTRTIISFRVVKIYLLRPLRPSKNYSHSDLLVMVLTTDTEPVWDKPVDVPEKWIEFVDDNVLASKLASSITRSYSYQNAGSYE